MALVPLPAAGVEDWWNHYSQLDMLTRHPQSHPLGELRSEKLLMSRGEQQSIANGAEVDLLNTAGPGNVESIWMATPGPAPSLDARLRVYYDGSATPALDMDMGTLLAAHYGAGQAVGAHMTPHVQFQLDSVNWNTGWMITFSMPFGTSIRVSYLAAGNGAVTGQLYWMATYSLYATDRADGMRLRSGGVPMRAPVALTAAQTYEMLNVTGGPGALVWHSYVGGFAADSTNLSWMERNFEVYVDGEGTPSLQATGTEDWFDSAWYFEGWRDFNAGLYSYVGTDVPAANPYAVGMATDFLGKWGGIPFTSSVVVNLATEAACTTGHTFSCCLLYYSVS